MTIDEQSGMFAVYCRMYSTSSQYQDCVAAFMNQVVAPYIHHLHAVIARRILELKGPEVGTGYSFNLQGTNQVNVAHGGSTITAQQSVRQEFTQLSRAAQRLIETLDKDQSTEVSPEIRQDLREVATMATEELSKPEPRPGRLRILGKQAMQLVQGINATNAVVKCVEFMHRLAETGS